MATNLHIYLDKYYPIEVFLQTVKKYDVLLNFSEKFFKNLKSNVSNRREFEMVMKSNLHGQQLMFILEILTFLSMDTIEFDNCKIINYIISDPFYDNLLRHLMYLNGENIDSIEKPSKDSKILVDFYEAIIFYLPVCDVTYQKIYILFQMTYECMKIMGKCDLRVFERLKELIKLLENLSNSHERQFFHYSNLSVFPTPVNLCEKNYLYPCLVYGSYKNSEEYIDVHFKLLRESFFQEIRDDFLLLRKHKMGSKLSKKYDLYLNIKSKGLCSVSCSHFKICHTIEFSRSDIARLKNVNWSSSKKFMNGSLLFFSQNNFTTFFVGTVEKNLCSISEGHLISLRVCIVGNPYQLIIGSCYDMLEPSSFFEPYFQSLKVLKSMNPYYFPMAEDIITVTKKLSASPLKQGLDSISFDKGDLNQSQHDALRACLTQKFTLIQGPPGTGKSYLTRKLVNILVSHGDSGPVLVICMRNRSLDIILEPLVKQGLKILRFGRTENEHLRKFTLYEYKKKVWNMSKFRARESYKFIKGNIQKFRNIINEPHNRNNLEAVEESYHLHDKAGEAMRHHVGYYEASKILSTKIQVIGATTTGAAKRNYMLSQIKPKTVIIEEAAEILEGFVVSSLPNSCDHLILIGDHLQLQPLTKLPKKFNMEISLFERMIKNGKGYNSLTVQHRMRPEIAELITPLFYEDLQNYSSVKKYPNVSGVSKNLFFLCHSAAENFKPDLLSFTNKFEVNLVLSFANYLMKQGYKQSQVSILAAYSAQQQALIQNVKKYPELEGVQIQTIDNYQGDENDIILLSLVRSCSDTIGFLSKPNRVNVALSRAKLGLYMFGNMETLCTSSQIWPKVRKILKKSDSLGIRLPLKCSTHNKQIMASSPSEIDKLELGGCNLVCNAKLDCGHLCQLKCHGNQGLHKTQVCTQPCLRKSCPEHNCSKLCSHEGSCEPCIKELSHTMICGHTAILKCSFDRKSYKCQEQCARSTCKLHPCKAPCHYPLTCPPCKTMVDIAHEDCGHHYEIQCAYRLSGIFLCRQPVSVFYTDCPHSYTTLCCQVKASSFKRKLKCTDCQNKICVIS